MTYGDLKGMSRRADREPRRSRGISLGSIMLFSPEELIELLWTADRRIYDILRSSINIHEARNSLFHYLNGLDRSYFNIYDDSRLSHLHDLEKRQAKWCVRILKNIIRTENENLAGASALSCLWRLARRRPGQASHAGKAFLCEMLFLFLGINGQFEFYRKSRIPLPEPDRQNAEPGVSRSAFLDRYAGHISRYVRRYADGLGKEQVSQQSAMRRKIMDYFKAEESQWNDYHWQMDNIIRSRAVLGKLIELTDSERQGLCLAEEHGIPVQITPYYLSLFNPRAGSGVDRALRAQVLPTRQYVKSLVEALRAGQDLDFMGESLTSPIDRITRRYVQVLILKAFDSCPQICVYCQRNWEIRGLCDASLNKSKLERALDWIAQNKNIEEVLLTGGDPLALEDSQLEWLLDRLAKLEHIQRIRIGTRVLVTLPSRITGEFAGLLARYHELGRREVCVMTHFESGLEMTREALEAIRKIKSRGINIYNQQVFTYYNSRKFETFALRKLLKRCGIDPYYCFNTKGKAETRDYRVPIARLIQEWTEEARLLPGLARTDTPVFNVPTLGKSYLHSWQDHEIIMILPDGRRVYRFYPWESMLALASPYIYTDLPLYDYLKRLLEDGEEVDDYYAIWYYF